MRAAARRLTAYTSSPKGFTRDIPTRRGQTRTTRSIQPTRNLPFHSVMPSRATFSNRAPATALTTFLDSTNGLVEFKASNFSNLMTGDLLTASFDKRIYRIQLSADGTAVTSKTVLFNSVGIVPLDVTAMSDDDLYPGTIWVCDYVTGAIYVFEPSDFDGQGQTGTGADDPNLDEDGDGYDNHDEILNGTNPLSAGDIPPDYDGDFDSDIEDLDDDNDDLLDTSDPFAIDPFNGRLTSLPLTYNWENEGVSSGGLLGLGFTGLMSNGTDYRNLYDRTKLTAGGAAGVLTLDAAPAGTALGSANSQTYGFQFGIDVDAGSSPLTLRTRLLAPFAGVTPLASQQMGFYFGTGDQDNYISLVLDGAGAAKFITEFEGIATTVASIPVSLGGIEYADLYLTVDPQGTAHAKLTVKRASGEVTDAVGALIAIPTQWFYNETAPAMGLIATAGNTGATIPVTWDFVQALPVPAGALSAAPLPLSLGQVVLGASRSQQVRLSNLGGSGDPAITINSISLSGDTAGYSISGGVGQVIQPGAYETFTVTFTPTAAGNREAVITVTHSGNNAPVKIPLTALGQTASTAQAVLTVTPDTTINASTYVPNSFRLVNTSGGTQKIQSVLIDLRTMALPDIVFDPNGTAGDKTAKGLHIDAASGISIAGSSYLLPHHSGYQGLQINFNGFDKNEQVEFSIDMDPTSIRGGTSPGPNESGSVSGAEMTGATVTIVFDDGSTTTATIFRVPNDVSAGRSINRVGTPPAPHLKLLGVSPLPAVVTEPAQTVRIFGPNGDTVRLLVMEGGMYTAGIPKGGFDLDPFEANSVIGFNDHTAVIGSSGYVDVSVTLTRSQNEAGINYLVAAVRDADGRTGVTSNVVVVKLEVVTNQAPLVNAGPDKAIDLPSHTTTLAGSVTDDGLPTGSVVTYQWSVVSGNVQDVNFDDASSLITDVTFANTGTYILRLTASDGEKTAYDDITVTLAQPVAQDPYRGVPFQVGQLIEVEDFDLGGEGIAYHDIESSNLGGAIPQRVRGGHPADQRQRRRLQHRLDQGWRVAGVHG